MINLTRSNAHHICWDFSFVTLLLCLSKLVVHCMLAPKIWILMFADSLKFTSALSVGLAVVFLVITVGISIIKLASGGIQMPRLLPEITGVTSFFNLFTVVPVLVTAYICHYNGKPTILHGWSNQFYMFYLKISDILMVICILYYLWSSILSFDLSIFLKYVLVQFE